jgi:hypothetical protein
VAGACKSLPRRNWVAAYDLLNEPLPNEHQHRYSPELRELYIELTKAIREVDPNHAITYEGSHWSTNWSIFTEVWDGNSILQFHKYWSPPDRPSIQRYIDVGRELALPIYMGEGGENNPDWIQTSFQLFDDCGISWNFWTWKKLDTMTSPCSVNLPPGWRDITEYAAGRFAKPTPAEAWQTLDALVDGMRLSQCAYRPEIIASLLRRPPLRIPAVGFGFGGAGKSYETSHAHPLPGFRSDDQVTIRHLPGSSNGDLDWSHAAGASRSAEGELLVSLGSGDWVTYEVVLSEPTRLDFLITSNDGLRGIDVSVDDAALEVEAAGPGRVRAATKRELPAGSHFLRLTGRAEEILFRSIEVTPASRQAE